MFSLLSQSIKDLSVLRRLEFAARFYPRSMPNFSDRLASFSLLTREGRNSLTAEQARHFVQNLELIDNGALASDVELTTEIVKMTKSGSDAPLGIVLISSKINCPICKSQLSIRADRPSNVTVYDDNFGTMPGTHYTKYCRRRGCSFQQHYGYFSCGDSSDVKFDDDWYTLSYFMSTRETAISMDMLQRLDKEILIGQVSYKQRAEIYNDVHGYNTSADGMRLVIMMSICLQFESYIVGMWVCTCTRV